MRQNWILLLLLACTIGAYGQKNRIKLKSNTIEYLSQKKYELEVNYYSIAGNIDKKYGIMFFSEKLRDLDALTYAKDLSPYQFNIIRKDQVSMIVKFVPVARDNEPIQFEYVVTNPNTKQMIKVPSGLKGDILDHRVAELLKRSWSSEAAIRENGASFVFNNFTYHILSYDRVKEELVSIINHYKLYKAETDLFSFEIEAVAANH